MRTPQAQHLGGLDQRLRLAEALAAGRRVELFYRDASGEATELAVDPLALTFAAGTWYLASWCHLRDGFRTFRLERIERVRTLRTRVAPGALPSEFDARRMAARSYFAPAPGLIGDRATVRLTGRLRQLGLVFFPQSLREFPDAETTLCHLRATDLPALANLVADFAHGAELVHPARGVELMLQLRIIPF